MKRTPYSQETAKLVRKAAAELRPQIVAECLRLLDSGAVDPNLHHRGYLVAVALENIATRYAGNKHYQSRAELAEIRNLRKF